MSSTPSTPSSAVFSVIKACVMSVLGLDNEHVLQGRQNGTAMPIGPAVLMTSVSMGRYATPSRTYNTSGNTETISIGEDEVFQLDCYGATAKDMCLTLWAFLNSPDGVDFFDAWTVANGFSAIEPLYATDPTTMTFVNEENQYEGRYLTRLHVNTTNSISVPMQTTTSATVAVNNVQTIPR